MIQKYAIRTAYGKQIVKLKGFTLNHVASKPLNFYVMKDMAISDEQHSIKIVGTSQIKKDLKRRQINTLPFGFALINCLDSCMYVLIILYN